MRIRPVIDLLLALLLLLGGCQLAQPEAATASESDLLVGVMLTPQPLDLFDLESYISDHGVPEDGAVLGGSGDYRQRLYAADLGNGRWQFEGVEGFAFFSAVVTDEHGSCSTMVNDGLADGSYTVHETDEGTSTDISCTLYVQPAEQICWYFNPVYQDGDGRVYLLPGSGMGMGGDNQPGMQISQTLSCDSTAADERGVTHSRSTRCAITVSVQGSGTVSTTWSRVRSYSIAPLSRETGSGSDSRSSPTIRTLTGLRAVETVNGSPFCSSAAKIAAERSPRRPSDPSSVPSRSLTYSRFICFFLL